ncbi:MAG: type VI secretion system tip protein VgrG [Acidobacteriota bacterium]|nr:type VI secretion system tip protein VgrG [Acidobacteriota bacterium]
MAFDQKKRQLQITTPLGEAFLLVKEFSASETISELFSFEVKLVHEETTANLIPTVVDPQSLLGQPVCVEVKIKDNTSRYFNGVVSHWRQSNRDTRFTYYQAIIVPKVWMLTQKYQSRIFQRLTVPQILKKVFAGFSVKQELSGTFSRREYCVQYDETDFAFASRLMEEEGIYYFFEHTASDHQMILANTPQSHRAVPTKARFPFEDDLTRTDGVVSSIVTWETDYQLQTGKISVWDHNFELPHRKLEADQPTLYPVGGNAALVYQYTGDYAKRYTGVDPGAGDQSGELQHIFEDNRRQAEIQMQALDAKYNVAHGTSNCCPLTAGHKFEMFNHSIKAANGQYLLTQVTHHAVQTPTLAVEPANIEGAYQNTFSCISLESGSTPFRPVRKTPRARIAGSQTAVVVGPAGEEIFTDKYGRVKVQFHWDRDGKYDASSSCWMRVSQPWAGGAHGTICIPRIGNEVIVDFIEADPDRPIITGSVYNPAQMPPYILPANSHTMGFKSNTTKGGGGYNEMAIVDGKAGELIRIHAQKDMDSTVLNNDTQYVVVDRTNKVDGKQHETVKGDKTTIVSEGNQLNSVEAGDQVNTVKGSITIDSLTSAVAISASTFILLNVGASSIYMDKDGVIEIKGKDIRLISEGPIVSVASGDNSVKGAHILLNSD